ncbi:MAG: hypothetical protein JSW73_04840 [Candidatus Woesearchaeota archaeon]|nr:MAG: hypothetical protein JSW73_04840 [Candidatus Woesearchaeota archaeon]
MRILHENRATSRAILGWTAILILAIVVLIIIISYVGGDLSTLLKSLVSNALARFMGIGV